MKNKKKNITAYIILISSLFMLFHNYLRHQELRQSLNLDGIFYNVKNLQVETVSSSLFSKKPYQKIIVKLPSLADENDDLKTDKNKKLVNKVIDREKLDNGIKQWLTEIFNTKEAKKYTDEIEVWYRDDLVISQKY